MDKKRTIIVGLGNPILTDDGIGVLVARELERALDADACSQLTITEAGAGGLRLMEVLLDFQRVVLIDASYLIPEQTCPGKIHRLSLADLRDGPPTQHSTSAHDTSLVTALDAAAQMGYSVPDEFLIYTVDVENVLEFSASPTAAVAAAVPRVVEMIIGDLDLQRR